MWDSDDWLTVSIDADTGDSGDDIEIPRNLIMAVTIYESINIAFPTAQILFRDYRGTFLDGEGLSKFKINLGDIYNDADGWHTWKMVATTMPDNQLLSAKDTAEQIRSFNLIDKMSLRALSHNTRKSFDKNSASKIVKKICESLISSYDNDVTYNIEESIDSEYYIQPGWNDIKYLLYLSNKAISDKICGGYVFWSDNRSFLYGDSTADRRFNFVTPAYLATQKQVCEIYYSNDATLVGEAEGNKGLIESKGKDSSGKGMVLAFGLSFEHKTIFNLKEYNKTICWYNLNDLSYREENINIDNIGFTEAFKLFSNQNEKAKEKYDAFYEYFKNPEIPEKAMDKKVYVGRHDNNNSAKAAGTVSMQRSYLKRSISILVFGIPDIIRLGDKVKIKVPLDTAKPFMESIDGFWLVTNIVHLITNPPLKYQMKVTLMRNEYMGSTEMEK